ncbi:MAG: hypothetical protein RIB98_14020 [Acidimicrobiales bacterium]
MTTAPTEPARAARSGWSSRRQIVGALLLVPILSLTASCGDDGDGDASTPEPDPSQESTTTTQETTTTTTTTTTTMAPTSSSSQPPTTSAGVADLLENAERCESPEGYAVSYPEDWVVNDGSVVPLCSQFDPGPFEVPDGTDARVAAITAYVDQVAFGDVTTGESTVDGTRAVTVVDGHQAVRLSGVTSGGQLHEDGTAVTRYIVDMARGIDDGPGTLFLDTIDITGGDHETHQRVLDAMVSTIELTGSDAAPGIVARYEGGGAPFEVMAEAADGDVCLASDTQEGEVCLTAPTEQTPIRSGVLGDGGAAVLVGVAAPEVFMIESSAAEGESFAVLPTGAETLDGVKAWAFPFVPGSEAELVWYDRSGSRGGTVSVGS